MKRHLNLLEEMANDAYAGNRSACLRAAIEDHARTLEGEDELAVKKLESVVRELGEQIAEVKQSLPDDSSENQSSEGTEAVLQQRSTNQSNQHQVYQIISTRGAVSLEEILSEIDVSLVEVADTLQSLCERGLITNCSDSGGVKYEVNDSGVVSHE